MSDDDRLRSVFRSIEVNSDFTEAKLQQQDGSTLHLCHRVSERWVRAEPADEANQAHAILQRIALFRLNAKHLEIFFVDGTRWEAGFPRRGRATPGTSL
jgi:hypothetical protein